MLDGFYEKVLSRTFSLARGKIGSIAFYVSFVAVFLFRLYYTSMFPVIMEKPLFLAIPYYAGLMVLICLSGVAIIESFFQSKKEAVFLICILLSALINAVLLRQFGYLLPFFVLIIASKNRCLRPVFILYISICSVFLLIAYYASMNGYIPYLVYDRGYEDLLSHAFGMNYRTTLACYVLCIIMCYAIVRAERMHLWEYLMHWLVTYFMWRYTWSRTTCFCMVLFLVVLGIILFFYHIKGRWIRIPKCISLIHAFCAAISFLAIFWWSTTGESVNISDSVNTLKSRLSLSLQAFKMYPVNLFGNNITERSAAGIPDSAEEYFYLDILYVRILFIGGIVLFIVYLSLMTIATLKAIKNQQVILSIALIIIALDGIVESHFLTLSFNVFILYSLGSYGSGDKDLSLK